MWLGIAEQSLDVADRVRTLQVRDRIEKKMTTVQIAEARTLARECIETKYRNCETEVLTAKEPMALPEISESVLIRDG